tara:strand:+ start:948 stop:3044 length:2097 start_codon:yes stop_codon:yes gene_type:complete
MNKLIRLKYFYIILYIFITLVIISNNKIQADQQVKILAEEIFVQENKETIEAKGNATAIGEKGLEINSDLLIYNEKENKIEAIGNVTYNDLEGNTFYFNKLTTDNEIINLNGTNAKARLDDGSRLVGSNLIKKEELTVLTNTEYTPCLENDYLIKNCPGWKLKSNKIYQNNKSKTIHYDHARIHLFNIPVFYLPYFSHPDPSVDKRSGLLMPTVETDQNLGDSLSIPVFYNIKSNLDLTFTPTIQTKSNNFYSFNYRQLNQIGNLNIDASIDDNDDKSGTSNHIFIDSKINNPFGSLRLNLQKTNNDTYMRKNKINRLTILNSGFNFGKSFENSYLNIKAVGYQHLTRAEGDQWEYFYPKATYRIGAIKDELFGGNLSLDNEFYYKKSLNNSYTSLASTQADWRKKEIHRNTGLVFDNEANFRVVSISNDNKASKDTDNVRFYPQVSTSITLPMFKSSQRLNQTITPVIMPILAPYNNYTDRSGISNSNIFSSNRSTSITEWESGPRINYGVHWFIEDDNNKSARFTIGQSYRINKNSSDTFEELSNYFFNNSGSIGNNYINNSVVIDRKNIDIRSISMNTYSEIFNLKLKVDYDYTSGKYSGSTNEQIAIGGEYNIADNFHLKFTGTKDIDSNKNVGYQYGLLYEDNCLGVDLNYYRDLTIDRDIKESDGYSFTVVLKPFGSTRSYGKSKVFGPLID